MNLGNFSEKKEGMAITDFAKSADQCQGYLGQTRSRLLQLTGVLTDFKYMKDFSEKNIYHLLSFYIEDQVRLKAFFCLFICVF